MSCGPTGIPEDQAVVGLIRTGHRNLDHFVVGDLPDAEGHWLILRQGGGGIYDCLPGPHISRPHWSQGPTSWADHWISRAEFPKGASEARPPQRSNGA